MAPRILNCAWRMRALNEEFTGGLERAYMPALGNDAAGHDHLVTLARTEPRRFRLILQTYPDWRTADLAERLKAEADRHWVIDAGASLRLARAIVLLGRLMGDARIVALGTMARADAVRLLGEPTLALRLADSAASRYRLSGDRLGWARTRISAMGALLTLGRPREALAMAAGARTVFRRQGEFLRLARLEANTALVYTLLDRRAIALQRYAAVLAMCQRLATPEAAALRIQTQVNRAIVLAQLARPSEALEALEEARTHYAASGERLALARTEWNIGWVLFFLARHGPALRAFEDARATFSELAAPIEVAQLECDMLECYLAINQPARVLTLAATLKQTLEARGLTLERAGVSLLHARALQQLGRGSAALELLAAGELQLAAANIEIWRARYALERAATWLSMRSLESAAIARQQAEMALAIFRRRHLRVDAARAQLIEAQAGAVIGPIHLARRKSARAVQVALALDVPWMIATALALHARLTAEAGDLEEAAAGFAQAIGALERMQRYMTFEMRRDFLSSAHVEAIYTDAIGLAARRQLPEEVFMLIERAKSRALLDRLTGGSEPLQHTVEPSTRPLLLELETIREEYQVYCSALAGRASEHAAALLPVLSQAELATNLRRCERRMHALLEAVQLRNPTFGDEATLRGLMQLDPRRFLGRSHLIVSYYALHDDLLIATLDRKGGGIVLSVGAWPNVRSDLRLLQLNFDSVAAAVGRGDLGAAPADSYRQREQRARGILQRLWRHLLAPIGDAVARATRLTILPYGPLHALPFHALHDGEHYLVQKTAAVSIAPSASVLTALIGRARRQRASADSASPPFPSVIVGTTLGGRLPHVAEEVRAVTQHVGGDLLVDEQATRAAVLARIEQAPLIHLATHGARHASDALFSFVELADGRLSTADILGLRLTCRLVTLSACETGQGHLGGGDDLAGLRWTLLYAGASALILSLWQVEDRATAALMDTLYAGLVSRRPLAKDVALQRAQRAVLNFAGDASTPATSHPYFWAAFNLIGDPRPIG
jgi:tetratricopeptide (TPR) repeat protein